MIIIRIELENGFIRRIRFRKFLKIIIGIPELCIEPGGQLKVGRRKFLPDLEIRDAIGIILIMAVRSKS